MGDKPQRRASAQLKSRAFSTPPVTTKKPTGRSHGFRHKSRSVMTKRRPRGVSFLLREYSVGDRALVIIDPRQH